MKMIAVIVNKAKMTGYIDLKEAMNYFGGKSFEMVESKILDLLQKKKWSQDTRIINPSE